MLDLRSDTLSIPQTEWIEQLRNLEVGDAAYDQDNSVKDIEKYCATLFGMEDSIFLPSGTMANQIAILSHTQRGDEVLSDFKYHINYFESSQTSALCGVTLNLCDKSNGIIEPKDIDFLIHKKARGPYYARPTLLHIENSVSLTGGNCYTPQMIEDLSIVARQNKLKFSLDGARILNACVFSNCSAMDYGKSVDSISMCFSKGLCSPFGSILVGNEEFISKAKIYRKWLGGALHQIGYLAFIALKSIQSDWFSQLKEDHIKANNLSRFLKQTALGKYVQYGGTNIIHLNMPKDLTDIVCNSFQSKGVNIARWSPTHLRIVTYKNISYENIQSIIDELQKSESFEVILEKVA